MKNDIISIYEEYYRLYIDMKMAAEDQLKGLNQDDMNGFSKAAGRRDEIQERISTLDERTGGAAAVQNEDQRVREARQAIKNVIQQILDMDRRMVEMAAEKRDIAARDMDRLKRGRKGVRGYGKSAPSRPKFVDQQS